MSANESKQFKAALALELTCPICLQLFTEPVSLACGHIFCFDCLQIMGEGLDQHSCPECQAEYSGSESLVKSMKICNIVETYKTGQSPSAAHCADVGTTDDISVTDDLHTVRDQSSASRGQASKDGGGKLEEVVQSGSESTENVLTEGGHGGKSKMELKEPKFRLASQIAELKFKLETAEGVLKKYEEAEHQVITTNASKREKVSRLLEQISQLSKSYSETVTRLIEEELKPTEVSVNSRVRQASELTKQLRQAVFRAEALMSVEDEAAFRAELHSLQPHVSEFITQPVKDEETSGGADVSLARVCPILENMNAQLREQLGEIQRCLRGTLNPSELTFDPETAHPNLLLSEDLKTVTFSNIKQTYPLSPQRFTSFFQVLSSQSFSEGDHHWEVELDGSPWIIGMCDSKELARHGVASALESSKSSWCLMWCDNLLSAFEQGHNVPLKKTTVSCRLEIELSFRTHKLSFYNISDTSGKTHVYTFTVNVREPLHLAYRMMSGHPKARLTIHA